MASYLRRLGEAVAASINAAETFTVPFEEAYFDFDPSYETLTSEIGLIVVSLGVSAFEPETQATDQARNTILVSVLRNVAAADSGSDPDKIDAMIELLGELRDHFRHVEILDSDCVARRYQQGYSLMRGDLEKRMYRQTLELDFDRSE